MVLCCAVLYCTVLCCAVLCCAVLCCAVLCCAVLYCTVLYCTVLYCTVPCCVARILWTAQVLIYQGMSSIYTSIHLTFSILLFYLLFLFSKCLTLKPANPEVLCLLAEVIGEKLDETSLLVKSCFAFSCRDYPSFYLFGRQSIFDDASCCCLPLVDVSLHFPLFISTHFYHFCSLAQYPTTIRPSFYFFYFHLIIYFQFIQGHLGDADMMKEHVEEALTLIGALNGPGVSKLTLASVYHKLASSFLSSVSTSSTWTQH